jgi:hypothetical protein
MELQDLLNEREWRRCRGADDASSDELLEAFVYFCETYWHIKHPERGRIRFELRDAQRETVEAWLNNRYTIILKARQIGFSTLAAAFAFWLCFFRPDRFVVMLSRTEREAIKLLQKAKYGYKAMPSWIKQRGPDLTSDNQTKMTFSNESSIESLPSGNDPARGESVYLVIVDEWAFLPNAEEAWASIEPIADVGGSVIGLSTANGSGDFFHQMWLESEIGISDFKPIFFPWSANEDRGEEWYESKRRSMPEWQLHQEYPRTPEEAFIKSGNPVFDVDKLMTLETVDPVRLQVVIHSKRNVDLVAAKNGEFSMWEEPALDGVYVIGADVSEGLGHGDYSCFHVINARTETVVANWHGHIDPDTFGDLLAEIGWRYNYALVGVESNNHGLTTLKALQRYGYRNIFRQRRLGGRTADITELLGWRTTQVSKPLAIDELAGSIRDDIVVLRCRPTITELKSFVRDPNGKMHGSPHDDYVMALAITWQMLKFVFLPEYQVEREPPRYSLDWFTKLIDTSNQDLAFKRVPIGAYNTRHPNS